MSKSDLDVVRPRKGNEMWAQNPVRRSNAMKNISQIINITNKQGYQYDNDQNYISVGVSVFPVKKPTKINEEKCKSFLKTIKKYGQEYCSGTSLHGLRYVGIEEVSSFERLFWIFSFIVAIGFSAYFINNVYIKWNLNPVIVSVNPEFKSISSIPFPAITICNMNQVKRSVADDIIASDNQAELLLLEDLCDDNKSMPNATDEGYSSWKTMKNFMLKVSQPCDELIVTCHWQGRVYPCDSLLNPAMTDEGICCTFNRVSSSYMYHNPWQLGDFNITFPSNNIDWTPEVGYPNNVTRDTWPFRADGAGSHLGLTLVSNVNASDYYCSSTNSVGLKVRLHSPVESPLVADFSYFLHPRKENRVAISPNIDEAANNIYKIPIELRQCFFSYERVLFFYRTYTRNNCETECISNYTLQECNCVPVYLPKNINTKICGKKKEVCYKRARSIMETYLNPEILCNCLPACYEITYSAEVSIGDISNTHLLKPYVASTELTDLIVIHFYFQNMQFRSFQKTELYGFTEFLANSGGLLGLFLGFSFLSAVELGYHLTLKLWCAYYKKQMHSADHIVYPFTK